MSAAVVKKEEKKICCNAPANFFVLGELTFKHPYFENSPFDLKNVLEMRLCKYYYKQESPTLDLHIYTTSFKLKAEDQSDKSEAHDSSIKCEFVICDNLPEVFLDDLFLTCFTWAVKNIAHGSLEIQVGTTLAKLPISIDNDLMIWITGKDYSQDGSIEEPKKFYAKDFYKELKVYQNSVLNCNKVKVENVQHEGLISQLRPYQCRAVQWMLERECGHFQVHNTDWLSDEVTTVCGKKLYYYPYSRILSDKKGPYGFPETFPSGILADEMGLGKTLVVLALILNHQRDFYSKMETDDFLMVEEENFNKNSFKRELEGSASSSSKKHKVEEKNLIEKKSEKALGNSKYELICVKSSTKPEVRCVCGKLTDSIKDCVQCPGCLLYQHKNCTGYEKKFDYFCPSCWPNQPILKSKGTLIVAPTSIYHQWKEEIEKHVDNTVWHRGVYMFSSVDRSFIQPSVLASYDIVITTYTSLPSELPHTVQKRVREFRHKRQYLRKCSPIALIEWWRVCLDEAQLVEAGSPNYIKISEMAKLIPTVNRWSVTGTPIQKSVNDLYYLFNWTGIKPFEDKFFWDNYLYKPYLEKSIEPLFSVLSQVFWRNSKEEVDKELNIPEQVTEYHILKFSAVEHSFYMQEHANVVKKFLNKLEILGLDLNHTLDSLDRQTLDMVLNPLLSLRQACSHHLAVGDQFDYMMKEKKGKKNRLKKIMRLDALLNSLQDRRKNECEDTLKNYFCDFNCLGDIYSIVKDWENAIKNYQEVLVLDREYQGKINVDVLQKIHAINKYCEVLEEHSDYEVPDFVKNVNLKKEAEVLEIEFLKKPSDEYDEQKEEVENFRENRFLVSFDKYFQDGVDAWFVSIIKEIIAKKLFDKFIEEISEEFKDKLEFLKKVMSKKDMKSTIKYWLKKVKDHRGNVNSSFDKLVKSNPDKLALRAVECHLRKADVPAPKKKCKFCVFEANVIAYERSLFFKEDHLGEDILKPLNEENLLKLILKFGESNNLNIENCLRDGKNFFELLKVLKKEVEQFILLRNKTDKLIRAKNEVALSKSLFEEFKKGNFDLKEIELKKKKLENDLKIKESELKKKYGSYLYLKELGKEDHESRDCPICLAVIEDEWCVLTCGHLYCAECCKLLIGANVKDFIRCSICREMTRDCDVGFVSISKGEDLKDQLHVIGDHSTKITAVVKTIKDLKKKEPNVKIIIFSTWEIVLKILRNALKENHISFRDMIVNEKWLQKKWEMEKYFEDQLREFKDPDLKIDTFLLPLHLGSKGLNLIEATHVFLIEPILNPAEELQAIGRVHRMGQTKKTYVHRFLIKGTIEEKIHSAVVSKSKEKWDRKEVTLNDLKNLFAI